MESKNYHKTKKKVKAKMGAEKTWERPLNLKEKIEYSIFLRG
jgi:hypothetical protein